MLISYNYNIESCSCFEHILLIREHEKGLGKAKTLCGQKHTYYGIDLIGV